MSYLVLARKYRPRTFAEVAGQDLITRTLQGAIRESRIGHAYLFTGPRGTGKTTSARIFAKALNCEQGPTPDPCGMCERDYARSARETLPPHSGPTAAPPPHLFGQRTARPAVDQGSAPGPGHSV